jgi:hypothetical protein
LARRNRVVQTRDLAHGRHLGVDGRLDSARRRELPARP